MLFCLMNCKRFSCLALGFVGRRLAYKGLSGFAYSATMMNCHKYLLSMVREDETANILPEG